MSIIYISINRKVKLNSILWPKWKRWYLGITDDPQKALKEHGYPRVWGCWEAKDSKEALEIVNYFFRLYSIRGNAGDGREENKHVFLYKS